MRKWLLRMIGEVKGNRCICIENNYNNSNFTVGRKYEYKEDGHIETDCGGMWIKHYEPFKINNGVFECGMCRFLQILKKLEGGAEE